MPRRGEYTEVDARAPSQPVALARVGVRQVVASEANGQRAVVTVDPGEFGCAVLAAELADEWVELASGARFSASNNRQYRQAIRDFCSHIDASVPRPRTASLAERDPDLHLAVTEWLRVLPTRYAAGSRTPGWLASRLRILVGRRIAHPDRAVDTRMDGWVGGALGLRRGQTQELDEFSRADKKKLIAAAWTDALAVRARLRAGWEAAAAGADPRTEGWADLRNLLWAVANGACSFREISAGLPGRSRWPAELHDQLQAAGLDTRSGKLAVSRHLVNQLFLSTFDLQPYRILLVAATGRTPEEVTALTEDDVEFGPRSVMIDFTKNRARSRTRQSFSTPPATGEGAVLHPAKPRLDAALIVRMLLEANRPLAAQAGISPVPLFLRTGLAASGLSVSRMNRLSGSGLIDWMAARGVSVEGVPDIRRLRKSVKVEKAVAYRGRVSDIADDHSVETFRRHYAHGTTLRVIAGDVITTAQRHWFTQALDGPVVLTPEAEESLGPGRVAAALGLTADDVEKLRTGQLDMGVSSCRDPFDSPYGRTGQLCPVAPTRCLECRNAFVLPSNLPQLLLFAAHLERLKQQLSPTHFHTLWGQSRVNVAEAIRSHTDAEIAAARSQINDQCLTLHLPLASHVEFDA
ncbi:hypothetical protein [Streptomyces sp. TLI_171]|uniref:hypothetical protein n=1 Tax=Streptomyces sp. TLI_171 TaxID=1938859 RepID=UPI000C1A1917|nr:hypothetical protein [Streptomyces sp. TLI_171]RKE05022.1 hypothetical protein BX266_7267 [Streptomyces sp. TLI_171]